MWSRLQTLIFAFLCCISVSSANPQIIKVQKDDSSGVRCGTAVFKQTALLAATEQAISMLDQNAALPSYYTKNPYPLIYSKTFGFEGESEESLLWPLWHPEQAYLPQGTKPVNYFLVIGKNLQPIGVVESREPEIYLKCVNEPDISLLSDIPTVSSFQCPAKFFSIEQIDSAIRSMATRSTTSDQDREEGSSHEYLANFNEGMSVFGITEPLFIRPIQFDGKTNHRAHTSIVVDADRRFIGMVQKRGNIYMRCRAAPYNDFVPRFVATNILLEPLPLYPGYEDVFQCGVDFIRSETLLNSAHDARAAFKRGRHYTTSSYPMIYQTSFIGEETSSLFLWPVDSRHLDLRRISSYSQKAPTENVFFIIVNNFSDIVGLVVKIEKRIYTACERKAVPSDLLN